MSEDSQPPPLPKRPTIIRSAPPPPSTTTASQNGHKLPQPVPSRPIPPRPVPKPPTPTISNAAKISQDPPKDSKSQSSSSKAGNNNNTSTRRKLEITIVDARPMNEIGFRDVKCSPASASLPKPANGTSPHETETAGDKEEPPVSVKLPPPRPSKSIAVPTPSPQDSLPSPMEGNTRGDKDSSVTDKNDPGEAGPPKPKRPTIIRPQSQLLRQQAMTSQDAPPDFDEKKSPPPLPSLPPSTAPKVPPLPSRPPVASSVTSPPPVSRPPPPKPKSQPVTPSGHQEKMAPVPKPRPRSTVFVSSISPVNTPSDEKLIDTASSQSKDMVEPPGDLPQRPKRPTIIRPKSAVLPSNSQSSSVKDSSQGTVPTLPTVPTRPLPPTPGQRPVPVRPSAPMKEPTPSSSTSNTPSENVYETVGEIFEKRQDKPPVAPQRPDNEVKAPPVSPRPPVKSSPSEHLATETPIYAFINKAKSNNVTSPPKNNTEDPESNKLPFQVKLKSTLSLAEDTKTPTNSSEEASPTSPPKPVAKPKPNPKPKPSVKPKPKSKPSSADTSDESKSEDAKVADDGKNIPSGGEKETVEKSTTVKKEAVEKSTTENKETSQEPHHISAAFLAKFEPIKDSSEDKKETSSLVSEPNDGDEKEESGKVEMRISEPRVSSSGANPPRPAKRPVTIIGRPSSFKRKEEKSAQEADSAKPSSLDDTSVPLRESNKAPPPPKRPVTIIGVPRRTSKDTGSVDKESDHEEVSRENSTLPAESVQEANSEKIIPAKPNRPPQVSRPPPQVSRPPPPVMRTPVSERSESSTTEENVHGAAHESTPSSDVDTEEVRSPEEISKDQNQNVTDRLKGNAVVHRPPSRPPSGPPRPARPSVGQRDVVKQSPHSEDKESEEVTEEVLSKENISANDNKDDAKEITEDPKVQISKGEEDQTSHQPGLRPPRPASVALKRTSFAAEETNTQQKAETSPPERPKPPRPQPAKPPAPKTTPKQSGPPSLPPRPAPGHHLYHHLANEPHGIASHDYKNSQSDELSFKAGDVILITKEVDQDWLLGKVGLDEGIFPKDFVELKYPAKNSQESASDWHKHGDDGHYSVGDDFETAVNDVDVVKPDNLTGPRCRARFDFEGEGEGELAVEDGDVIRLIKHVGTEWMKGELNGRTGIFPSAFVEIIEDVGDEEIEINQNEASALFDFDGEDGELSFQAGDTIDVKSMVNSEWLFGECFGRSGKFPATFISHIPSSLPQHTTVEEDSQDDNNDDANEMESVTLPSGDRDGEKKVIGHCTAVHNYDSDTPGDLKFKSGDRLEVLEFVGEDWIEGRCNGEEGLFPSAFVIMEESESAIVEEEEKEIAEEATDVLRQQAVALHDFHGETDSDLPFEAGDVIEIHEFVDDTQEWRWGTFQGKRGMFPSSFVELC